MSGTRRAVIAAGGTGGHFYPGYVLGRALRERGAEPLFLVRESDPACERLELDRLAFVEVPLRGMPRRPGAELLRFAGQLLRSMGLTRRIVADFRPDVVVGMGGYLTFPASLAARLRGVPVLLHESNAVLGLANRASLPFARRLAMGLPLDRTPRVPAVLTGTPVRDSLWSLPDPAASRVTLGLDPEALTVLVFGGSQGARALNGLVPQALRQTASSAASFQVLHIAGPRDSGAVTAAYAEAGLRAVVRPYLHEMEQAYAAADLAVCRSGASTLAELAATRRPALLIPYPAAAAGHQERNARLAERAGAARCLVESRLGAGVLAQALLDLLGSRTMPAREARSRLAELGGRWSSLGLPAPDRAVQALADAALELAGGRARG